MLDERPQAEESPTSQPPGVPVWVKGLGIALGVLVVVVLVVMLFSGGQHGPGMHG